MIFTHPQHTEPDFSIMTDAALVQRLTRNQHHLDMAVRDHEWGVVRGLTEDQRYVVAEIARRFKEVTA